MRRAKQVERDVAGWRWHQLDRAMERPERRLVAAMLKVERTRDAFENALRELAAARAGYAQAFRGADPEPRS